VRRKKAASSRPRVLILEPDVEGFQRPLAQLLSSRSRPLELVSLEGEKDLSAAVARERPCLVIVNASAAYEQAEALAKSLSAAGERAEMQLVAVVEPHGGKTEELSAAGFDAVLAKPVHFSELERLLAS
jgi:hypothetical protein